MEFFFVIFDQLFEKEIQKFTNSFVWFSGIKCRAECN